MSTENIIRAHNDKLRISEVAQNIKVTIEPPINLEMYMKLSRELASVHDAAEKLVSDAVFDGMRFYLSLNTNDAFVAGSSQNVKFYSNVIANCDSGLNITNLISTTDYIKDTDVEFYKT